MSGRTGRRGWEFAAGAVVAATVVLVHWPVMALLLTGDDYPMVAMAHRAVLDPAALLAPIGEFLRPLTVWTYVLDWWLWPHQPAGAHATTLAIHVATAVALLAAGRRLGLGLAVATAVALLWGCSPFTDENAVWAAIRHENTLLLGWLVVVLAWPGPGARWSRSRAVAAGLGVLVAALSKETWVATPFLLVALELVRTRWSWRPALALGGAATGLACAYVVMRFLLFPGTRGYYEWSPAPLAKVPHLLAAFLGLERLVPVVSGVGWRGLVALAVVTGLAAVAWRRRQPAATVGLALLLPPLGPVLLVPYLPQRYAAIPWAGFLLLVAGLLADAPPRLRPRLRRGAAALAGAVALWVLGNGVVTLRADLEDWRRVSEAHRVLLEEAGRVAAELPLGVPVAVVRGDRSSPLDAIVRSPRGLEKLQFVRGSAPYGLIEAGDLFDWVLGGRGVRVRQVLEWGRRFAGVPGRVLVHRQGGFQWTGGEVPDLAAAAAGWASSGLPVAVIVVERVE